MSKHASKVGFFTDSSRQREIREERERQGGGRGPKPITLWFVVDVEEAVAPDPDPAVTSILVDLLSSSSMGSRGSRRGRSRGMAWWGLPVTSAPPLDRSRISLLGGDRGNSELPVSVPDALPFLLLGAA